MRKYEFKYRVEVSDECDYREKIIQSSNIEEAIIKFKEQTRVYKRITQIKEL